MPDPLAIAKTLLATPTAPFHEARVATVITDLLDDWGIPYSFDDYGNLIARYNKGTSPRWALMAHMDHPGIDITHQRGRSLSGVFLGGVRPDSLPGARVRLYGAATEALGTIDTTAMVRGEKRITITLDHPDHGIRKGDFGCFELAPASVTPQRIRANAVDDLIGCATTLSVLAQLKQGGHSARVWGVFTRAEELGFIGAQLLAESKKIPRDMQVISLESSKEMAGARQGKGPVIRVGDRGTSYSSAVDHSLHTAAKQLAEQDSSFRFQRQLMTGGSCEGTVFTLHGYPTGGLAYPLFNYHNMVEPEGVDREEIDTQDYLNGVKLLHHAVCQGKRLARSGDRYLNRLTRATARYRKRLQ